ncbi:hypothetical protein E8L90_29635 [Brevibacillus antibioticus]|uniref:Mannosyl-glycoprotein endo-beta-N-acetylglucosamidase-like domain-containing protein n=1 Tax=Brevibacillus antibioticus TaxID=2570228 RepID=A0A4U2XYD2_9BACL|nr:glycoside hydrolase family 73 protein [Brevibacillus antibioticus]TKI52919.1 hypothetical protein E8L90_29635 [Brevibacillus antibioticus]
MSKQQTFIKLIAEAASQLHQEYGIFASVSIAQACLETGWGKFIPVDHKSGKNSNNLFGVKAFNSWKGDRVTCQTWEVYGGKTVSIISQFRAYSSIYESLRDHHQVLLNPRYLRVRQAKTAEEAAQLLHVCGYATDPQYGDKLVGIINQYNLKQYDYVKEDKKVEKDIANEIITQLQAMWKVYDHLGMLDKKARMGELADELRIASGQQAMNR